MKLSIKNSLLAKFVAFAGLLLLPSAALAGSITGVVSLSGKVAKAKKLNVSRDKVVCGKALFDQSLLVGQSGGLKNAVVFIVGAKGAAKPKTVTIDQRGCEYAPHVVATTAGSSVRFINSDNTMHNVHGYLATETVFNLAMPMRGMRLEQELEEGGVHLIKCDLHEWMTSYVAVFEHPYFAVTDEKGAFAITGVPPGTYKMRVWHEQLGKKTVKVKVGKAAAKVKISY